MGIVWSTIKSWSLSPTSWSPSSSLYSIWVGSTSPHNQYHHHHHHQHKMVSSFLVTAFILFRNLGDCSLHPPDAIGGASELGQPNKSSLSALCGEIVESSLLLLLFTVITLRFKASKLKTTQQVLHISFLDCHCCCSVNNVHQDSKLRQTNSLTTSLH